MPALVVAVTGGIGSGKSTVCEAFARFGVGSIDTDQIAREVVVPGEPGFEAVVRAFGTSVLDAEGALDRRRVKSMVFADPTLREQLEAILHPLIRARVEQLVHEVEAPYCLVCIPLLTEGTENALVDRVLVVDCPEELQIERVVSRDDLTEREVLAIMHTQASREERLKIADDVIYNDGNREELTGPVSTLHETYSQLALAR